MKIFDISKVFSEKIAGYVSKGYVINIPSMGGSQGEEAKVDLVKGEELIRVWVSKEHDWSRSSEWKGNTMVIRVGKWIHPASKSVNEYNTVWMSDIDVIEKINFYEIGCGRIWYTNNLMEAKEAKSKTSKRCYKYLKNDSIELSDKAKSIAYKYLKTKADFKMVCIDDIQVMKDFKYGHRTSYYIIYRGHTYDLS